MCTNAEEICKLSKQFTSVFHGTVHLIALAMTKVLLCMEDKLPKSLASMTFQLHYAYRLHSMHARRYTRSRAELNRPVQISESRFQLGVRLD